MSWHIDGTFDADVNVDIRDENDIAICEVGPFEEDWTPDEIERAHLIAAAPELLGALQAFLARADSWHKETGHDEHGVTKCDGICECRDAARAAIAKAKGDISARSELLESIAAANALFMTDNETPEALHWRSRESELRTSAGRLSPTEEEAIQRMSLQKRDVYDREAGGQ